jgi:hypothetical protein
VPVGVGDAAGDDAAGDDDCTAAAEAGVAVAAAL